MSEPVLLAVYGTLKRGYGNHSLIAAAQYIGNDKLQEISLYDIGPYPGARLEASAGIDVEVYAVTPSQLARLDLLEEYDPADPRGSLYTRELLDTRFGSTWVYLFQGDVAGKPCLRSGAWVSPAQQALSQESEE
jgi:gamma-glutamylcyclotransferase (GGCT)/AIG2-like uncharacterized protein YtfP